jgi:hypothetical protein
MAINVYKQSASGEWTFVSTGEMKDFISTAFITPTEKAYYKFEIIAPEFYEGYTAGHYGLLLLHN